MRFSPAGPPVTADRAHDRALLIMTGDGFKEASVCEPAQVSPFTPVHQPKTVHLIGLTQQFLVIGAGAIASLLHVVVKPKPLVDHDESARFLAYLFANRVHVDNPSGLLVMSWRRTGLVIMLKTLYLHIGE